MNTSEILKFLANPANVDNCEDCPYNNGSDSFQNRKPCGQWNCWVEVHCERYDEDMEV